MVSVLEDGRRSLDEVFEMVHYVPQKKLHLGDFEIGCNSGFLVNYLKRISC